MTCTNRFSPLHEVVMWQQAQLLKVIINCPDLFSEEDIVRIKIKLHLCGTTRGRSEGM